MSIYTLIEERIKDMPNLHMKQMARKILTKKFEQAQVGNKASEELEEKWGYVSNKSGMDYADSNWS